MTAAMTRSFVMGGAGFIGSHLVDLLVDRGPVTVYDNLSVGKRAFIAGHLASGRARLVENDALDLDALAAAARGHDVVFHLAANPEARWGLERTRLDLEQGTIATYNALEAARLGRCRGSCSRRAARSTATPPRRAARCDLGNLPISLYGASKLAAESLDRGGGRSRARDRGWPRAAPRG